MKVIIVGGVAGGASTAARLRRLDEKAEIIMIERGEHISFANCGLPYYIGEIISERKKLLVQTPKAMKARFNIDVRTQNEVIKIDRENKEVQIKDLKQGKVYKEGYDKLVLSPGAEPIKPPLPGIDSDRIFMLRNIPDTDAIKSFVDGKTPKSAVVVGGGFIGLEMAENLHHRGLSVSIIEMVNQVMPAIDFEMAAILHQHMKLKNIDLFLSDGVKSFQEEEDGVVVTLQSGKQIKTDLVILSIGVRPETKLASDAGLVVNRGIVVDETLETSDPHIYALGDAVEVKHFVSGDTSLIPLAGPANKQGRIVADRICGRDSIYKGTQGTAIAKVFDLTVAFTGFSEKSLQEKKIPFVASITHSASHAGYYPKAVPMSIKLLFSPDNGTVLGAQIVGVDGVDKRLDVLATALRHKLTVYDLTELELAYAPPFSSAKDPVNMAGYVASNILKGDTQVIGWHEIGKCNQEGALLLDVRDKAEHENKAIANSLNIPVNELREHLDNLPKDKKIIIYCQIGLRGYSAHRILKQNGFDNVYNLSGGFKTYQTATFKQDRDSFGDDQIDGDDLIKMTPNKATNAEVDVLDTCGLQCPGPIMQLSNKMKFMQTGQTVQVLSSDLGFASDVESWARRMNNRVIELSVDEGVVKAFIQKGMPIKEKDNKMKACDDKTIVVFSNDLDKVMASFIIANGALAMNRKVTMFFTFWGLSVLRKKKAPALKKSVLEKMFGWMLPKGTSKLTLSKMHMAGMGTAMMKMVMKDKHVNTLEELIGIAKQNGIRLIACQMSMDVMGIKKEELMDGVEVGGVATYLDTSEESNMNLFI